MIVLNKETVLENARQAYFDGRLQALHFNGAKARSCRYRDDKGHCCVIGASLNDETAARFDRAPIGVRQLQREGQIDTDDIDFLSDLQNAHDRMMVADSRHHRENLHQYLRALLRVECEPNPD